MVRCMQTLQQPHSLRFYGKSLIPWSIDACLISCNEAKKSGVTPQSLIAISGPSYCGLAFKIPALLVAVIICSWRIVTIPLATQFLSLDVLKVRFHLCR